ncbi:hypothetical protein P3L10_016324 [Capsicum annuum]
MSLNEKIANLIKKAKELSILCNIVVALIIMCPREIVPIIWPNKIDFQNALTRFESCSEVERFKKLDEHERYLSRKVDEQKRRIKKIERKNKEKIMEIKSNQLFEIESKYDKLCAKEIKKMLKLSDLTRAKLNERKKQLNQQFQTSQPPLLSSNFEQTTQDYLGQINYFQIVGASTSLVQTTQHPMEDYLGQNNYFQTRGVSTSLVQTIQPPTEDYLGQNNCFQIGGALPSLVQTTQPPTEDYLGQNNYFQIGSASTSLVQTIQHTTKDYLGQNRDFEIVGASTGSVNGSDSNRGPIEGRDDWSYFFP